jgi:SPP1 family predicted phage head-tail adaptor
VVNYAPVASKLAQQKAEMMARIAPMRHPVTIQAATLLQDEYGEPIEGWADIAVTPHIWANIQSRAPGERFISGAEQVQATISHTIRVRYRPDLSPVRMRLVEDANGITRIYNIENVIDPTGYGRELILMCSEVQE